MEPVPPEIITGVAVPFFVSREIAQGTQASRELDKKATLLLEVHILDFNEDVYGQLIEVMFRKKIRNELKFDGIDALKTQIGIDVEDVRKYFNEDSV